MITMDEDLKDIIKMVGVSMAIVGGLITVLDKLNIDTKFIVIYVILLAILVWLMYLQIKISKLKGGKK